MLLSEAFFYKGGPIYNCNQYAKRVLQREQPNGPTTCLLLQLGIPVLLYVKPKSEIHYHILQFMYYIQNNNK